MTISDKLEPLFALSSIKSVCGTLLSELRHAKSRPYGKLIGKTSDTKALASNDRHGARKTRTVSETSKTEGSEVCDHEQVLARPSRRRPRTFAVSRKVLRLRFAWDNPAKTQETSGHNTVHTFHITATCTTPIPVISRDDDATRCPARPIGFSHFASCTRGEELLLRSLSSTSAR